jgi:hypothetical protein
MGKAGFRHLEPGTRKEGTRRLRDRMRTRLCAAILVAVIAAGSHPLAPFVVGEYRGGNYDDGDDGQEKFHARQVSVTEFYSTAEDGNEGDAGDRGREPERRGGADFKRFGRRSARQEDIAPEQAAQSAEERGNGR